MKSSRISKELIEETTRFHGHWCPGLAIGIRASEIALEEMGKAADEDVVAVAEADNCAVDAIQYLTGCTLGKGNLIFKDYGKSAFSFYRRSDGKSLRLVLRPGVFGEEGAAIGKLHKKMQEGGLTEEEERQRKEMRAAVSRRIMEGEATDVFELTNPRHPMPKKARVMGSLICEACGESTMESRTRRLGGEVLCIPCFELKESRC